MSEKRPHIVTVCLGDTCTKKKLKIAPTANFKLVGVVAVGMQIDGEVRVVLPITAIDFEDFKKIAEKYGISIDEIAGYVTEIKEEKKGERVIKFETGQ